MTDERVEHECFKKGVCQKDARCHNHRDCKAIEDGTYFQKMAERRPPEPYSTREERAEVEAMFEGSPRAALLDEAKGLITGDRNSQYGPPDQDFRRAAEIMNIQGYTGPGGRPLVGRDVAILQIAVKLSRLTWSPDKRDHYLDIAGYIACGWECKTLEEE